MKFLAIFGIIFFVLLFIMVPFILACCVMAKRSDERVLKRDEDDEC